MSPSSGKTTQLYPINRASPYLVSETGFYLRLQVKLLSCAQ
jgi:hypothetical protein